MAQVTHSESGADCRDLLVQVEADRATGAEQHAETAPTTSACRARRGAPALDPEHPLMGPHPTD